MARNDKTLDASGIIDKFGGKHKIVADFEKFLRKVLTVKAVEKWEERKAIPLQQLLNLKTIAEKRGDIFLIEDYIK